MKTILPKKAGFENPIATDDEHHQQLVSDPAITQFQQGTPYMGQTNIGVQLNQAPQTNLTQAGSNAAQGAEVLVENTNVDWINKKWRPMMGWMYMIVCMCDFVVFPVLWSLLQALSKGQVTMQYQPLTLQGAGLFHISMGAVLGIAAYGRTKEKIEGAAK